MNNMKQIIRLTESDLHRIVEDAVQRILREDAYGKYEKDLGKISDDINMSVLGNGNLGWAEAYAQLDDPMVKKIKGTTYGDMMKAQMGNDNDERDTDWYTKLFLNTPNAAQNYKIFPRMSAKRNHQYDSLANGSKRIQAYKNRRGV